jgi:hypothetical protein
LSSAKEDVDECAEWLRWKNFDEATSEETGEEDRVVVLGRGWLGPGGEDGKMRDLGGIVGTGVPGEGEEDAEAGFLGSSLR